jgi:DNA repair protein RadD
MKLRDYQQNVINEYEQKVAAGIRRIIIVAPTGAGKTVIAAENIRRANAEYNRVLFIAHRNELLTQARDKLKSFDIIAGIIKAGRDKDARPQAMVQVAGIQTLHARAVRAKTIELPPAEIVIFDECHHCRAMTYQRIIEAYPNAIIIGLTKWPACQFRDKFGSWPPFAWNNHSPLAPTDATLRWIRHRQIAYAKRRAA